MTRAAATQTSKRSDNKQRAGRAPPGGLRQAPGTAFPSPAPRTSCSADARSCTEAPALGASEPPLCVQRQTRCVLEGCKRHAQLYQPRSAARADSVGEVHEHVRGARHGGAPRVRRPRCGCAGHVAAAAAGLRPALARQADAATVRIQRRHRVRWRALTRSARVCVRMMRRAAHLTRVTLAALLPLSASAAAQLRAGGCTASGAAAGSGSWRWRGHARALQTRAPPPRSLLPRDGGPPAARRRAAVRRRSSRVCRGHQARKGCARQPALLQAARCRNSHQTDSCAPRRCAAPDAGRCRAPLFRHAAGFKVGEAVKLQCKDWQARLQLHARGLRALGLAASDATHTARSLRRRASGGLDPGVRRVPAAVVPLPQALCMLRVVAI
jgi:hypothetical protein